MRRLILLWLCLLFGGCAEEVPAAPAIAEAAQAGAAELLELTIPDAATPPAPPVLVVPPAETSSRKRLALSLRSTPYGAAVSIDGRPVGTTPLRLEVVDDGREHNFAFVLAGYEPWRLRFAPVKEGVIHATLRPLETGGDAGP